MRGIYIVAIGQHDAALKAEGLMQSVLQDQMKPSGGNHRLSPMYLMSNVLD